MGLSCYYHDSAIAVVDDNEIKFAIHEERLSRVKQDARFPVRAIGAALDALEIDINDFDRIVYYEDPSVKLRRLWDQVIDYWPRSQHIFDTAIPRFVQQKMPIAAQLRQHFNYLNPVEFSGHHRSHAASAFFTSPFERAIVLTLDGVGEYDTAAVHLGEGNRLTKQRSIRFPHSLGLFYSVFTQYLGFEVNEGEYKVMGLAPYGRPTLTDKLLGPILRLSEDGAFRLNERFFDFCSQDRHYDPRLTAHLGIAPRRRDEPVHEEHCNLAASVQQALEIAIAGMLPPLMREYGTSDFCFAGGVALNCTANARMIRDLGIRSHIHPAAGDAGAALGAALQSIVRGHENEPTRRYRFGAYLGVSHPDPVIRATLSLNQVPYREPNDIAETLADRLVAGQVVAILHGRDEWGPRALGGRSILADPRRAEMKDHLNAKIKFREEFRPFAPVVKEEAYGDWFETLGMAASPYMLYTHQALHPEQTAAVAHVDGTSRVQTVSARQNPYLYRILDAFERRTGVPVLINTSFNLRGEPIVASPSDALKTFFNSGIDCLALEGCLVEKETIAAEAPGFDAATLRTVHPITECEAFKALYWSGELPGMVPNLVFLNRDGSVAFESNEVGLKGDPLDPSRKLAVVWGDSVVFGGGRGWACLLDELAPGCQFLNGGLEGDPYRNILRRAAEFSTRRRVALNLVMLGWHPFVPPRAAPPRTGLFKPARAPAIRPHSGNENIREDLVRFLAQIPNTVVLTMPTALNAEIIDRDLSSCFTDGDYETGFRFLGKLPYSTESQRWAFEHIAERNAITREVCAGMGIRVIDLFAAMDTTGRADFREDFLDILHIRPRAFAAIAQIIHDNIKDLLVS
jgi:carbamoyltransferase